MGSKLGKDTVFIFPNVKTEKVDRSFVYLYRKVQMAASFFFMLVLKRLWYAKV